MKTWFRIGCFLGAMLFLLGCQKESGLLPGQVDGALLPFLHSFEQEGMVRNYRPVYAPDLVNMRFDTLSGVISGQCKTYSDGRREVVISHRFWAKATFYEKEFLVFHELGHCLLDREHLEKKASDGTCVSIMHSGQGDCKNAYGYTTRSAYLDELFYYD